MTEVMTDVGWSDNRVERLKDLWARGLASGRIARLLGGVSGAAVRSKACTLGISGRRGVSQGGRPPKAERASQCPGEQERAKKSCVDKDHEEALAYIHILNTCRDGIGLLELEPGQCHAPKGTSPEGDALYCGAQTPSKRHVNCVACDRRLRRGIFASQSCSVEQLLAVS
jgi:hypothetical protein